MRYVLTSNAATHSYLLQCTELSHPVEMRYVVTSFQGFWGRLGGSSRDFNLSDQSLRLG